MPATHAGDGQLVMHVLRVIQFVHACCELHWQKMASNCCIGKADFLRGNWNHDILIVGVSRRAACRYNHNKLQACKSCIFMLMLHEIGLVAKGECVYLSNVAAV